MRWRRRRCTSWWTGRRTASRLVRPRKECRCDGSRCQSIGWPARRRRCWRAWSAQYSKWMRWYWLNCLLSGGLLGLAIKKLNYSVRMETAHPARTPGWIAGSKWKPIRPAPATRTWWSRICWPRIAEPRPAGGRTACLGRPRRTSCVRRSTQGGPAPPARSDSCPTWLIETLCWACCFIFVSTC